MAKAEAAALLLLLLASGLRAGADGSNHRYKEGDSVPLYANKVGPFHNPSETYRFYDLPFCTPEHVTEKKEALGEVLNGDRLVDAPYELNFREDKQSKSLCKKHMSKEDVTKFRNAISKNYYFQMFYDDLPLWGFLGRIDKNKVGSYENKYLLFKHIQFDILYNDDRVIEISIQPDPTMLVDISEDKEVDVDFTYSVTWKKTGIPFEKRMEKYSKVSSMPQHLEIHWFSIVNSCVIVLLLTSFLATILMRVLKNDFIRYSSDEESPDDQEETGWKYIHGDVFRFPKKKSLFSAIIGSGTQLLALTTFIFLLALIATSLYMQLEGTNWVRNLILTGCLFCGPLFLTFCFLNTVAIMYSATAALPFGTILVILLIWALVTSPLLVLGGIAAFVTVALTYFQLAVEDHEWWWRSILCGGSTGVFIFFYCIYYYRARSDMSGFMQTSFFFGYMTCICYGFFLMLGAVGFHASLLFVRHIYRSIKCE
ncbi:hypothetical protein OPV22_033279 [Ensete ventricosum]|uniref:Transmembrane 9 superfamily member n=1 Tax=Ensete ventricosum TaxID=4639 RepID=A0AAV8Q0W6_ENSVE|nr:hypothetical protein OPV22_033279 [Ensete ventricosum]